MPKKKQVGSLRMELKLMPHLVPKPLWGKSAANLLKRAVWEGIRREALQTARHVCQVCSDAALGSALTCHELWDYDDKRGTATLVGLRMQCRGCDSAVHMGRAVKRGFGNVALAQLVKVNGIKPREAKLLYRTAMDEWKQRNKKQWRIVVVKSLLERYPELAGLEPITYPTLF
jgi:hypothetical protein